MAKADGLGIPNTRAGYLVNPAVSDVYETPGWMVGHEVRYSVDVTSPLPLEGARALEVGYGKVGNVFFY